MNSRSKRLTEAFYKWDHRGRGFQEWEDRVSIEPLFTPFWGHNIYADFEKPDDGKTPGLAERFSSWIKPKEESAKSNPMELLDYPDIPPNFLTKSIESYTEYVLTLPKDMTGEQTRRFISLIPTLTQTIQHLSFEIIATANRIVLVIAVPDDVSEMTSTVFRTSFPFLNVRKQENLLYDTWLSVNCQSQVVDYGLDHEFVKPLSPPYGSMNDSLAQIYRILNQLEEGQIGVFQVLITPTRAPWAQNMVRSTQTASGKPFFLDDEDMFHQVKAKVKSPLYATTVKVGVRSQDSDSCFYLSQKLAQALHCIQAPGSNALIPLESDLDGTTQQVDLLTRSTHRSGMILNEEEIFLLAHPPSPVLNLDRLERFDDSTREAPKTPDSHGITLGKNTHQYQTRDVILNHANRTRHMHVIGSTGSGKSNLLLNCIVEDILTGQGVGVLDPHGDLIDQVLLAIPENRQKDVILLDPADEDFPVPFNILKAHSELEKTLLASDLTSIFRRFATSWGDQMTAVLDNAVLAILNHPQGGTLRDLQRFLIEKPYREKFLEEVTDEQVVYYWKHEFPMLRAQPQASILTRLSMFLRPKPLRNMLLQPGNALDFEKIMDQRKILLVKLSHGLIGESNAHLLGALLVSKINQSVMARQAKAEDNRTPFWLYIDEFHNFACQSMSTILSGARKYQLGLILAHQDMKQVESRDSELAESILSNPYTRVCFRLGDRDSKRLESSFSDFSASDLQNLDIGNAICRFGQSDADFNLETDKFILPEGAKESTKLDIIDRCRKMYATPKVEVEKSLSAWLKSEPPEASRTQEKPKVEKLDSKPVSQKPTTPVKEVLIEKEPFQPEIKTDLPLEDIQEALSKSHPVESESVSNEEVSTELPSPNAGIGGDEHRRIQAYIKKLAEGFGYKAHIEHQISGRQLVDIALEKKDQKIAIEISVTTPPAKEILNITKSLSAGFESVIMTSPNPKTLSLIRKRAQEKLSVSEFKAVVFLLPDEISSYLVDLEAQAASCVEDIMGWEVETIYTNSEKLGKEQKVVQEAAMGQLAKKIERSRQRKKN